MSTEFAPYALVIIGLLFLSLFVLPNLPWITRKKNLELESKLELKDYLTHKNTYRATLAQIIGGILVLVGLYLTAQNLEITQNATSENLKLIREGQITDRYSRAVAMLGESNSLEVRLGGIYALASVAKASEEYYWPILMIYTDYLREHYPWNSRWKPKTPDYGERPQSFDASAILASIGKLNVDELRKRRDRQPDLAHTYLRAAWLKDADFSDLNIAYVNLSQANFINVQLTGSNLKNSCLKYAQLLEGTDLTNVVFMKSNIIGANFNATSGLKLDQLKGVFWDDTTIFPDSIEDCSGDVKECLKRNGNLPRKSPFNDPCSRNYKLE